MNNVILCLIQHILVQSDRNWGATGLNVPPDTPACGFYNELCTDRTGGWYFTFLNHSTASTGPD
jgi:hypothetical protein